MKWKIKNKTYDLPFNNKDEVLNFVNTDIKICPYCKKVDCTLQHVNDCNEELAYVEELKRDNLWK